MKIKKRIISILICMCLIGTIIISDYEKAEASAVLGGIVTVAGAVATAWTIKDIHEQAYDSYHNGAWNDIQEWCKKNWGPVGFLVSMNTEAEFFDNVLYPALVAKGILSEGDGQNQTSYDKLKQYVGNHYTINQDNSISYDSDIKDLFKTTINNYKDNSGFYYAYAFDIQLNYSTFASADMFNAVKTFITDNSNSYCLFDDYSSGSSSSNAGKINELNTAFVQQSVTAEGAYVKAYSMTNWSAVNYQEYNYNSGQKRFDITSNWYGFNCYVTKNNQSPNLRTYNKALCSYNGAKIIKVYKTLNDLQAESVGQSKYFFTQYNNSYMNSSDNDDYSISWNSNYNPITYSDIVNYNQDYYTDNGNYPTTNTTQTYITEYTQPEPTPTPTPTPDDPSGGGSNGSGTTVSSNGVNVVINNNPSASNTNNNTYTDNSTTNNNFFFNLLHGGTVSGNGTGNGSGGTVSGNGTGTSGNIFDWLGDLGQVLGNLIKNLGEALLNIIRGITELIESIVVGLPTMFFEFIGAVFGWLPEEWISLLSLSLACMLIYGIVKIFRG